MFLVDLVLPASRPGFQEALPQASRNRDIMEACKGAVSAMLGCASDVPFLERVVCLREVLRATSFFG